LDLEKSEAPGKNCSLSRNLDSNAGIAFTLDMTTLTIRKLDDEIKSRLKIRAAINGHSMEQEARLILKESLKENLTDAENGIKGIKRWRGRWQNRLSSDEILEMTRGS
jgi:predicted transcriptional regulator